LSGEPVTLGHPGALLIEPGLSRLEVEELNWRAARWCRWSRGAIRLAAA